MMKPCKDCRWWKSDDEKEEGGELWGECLNLVCIFGETLASMDCCKRHESFGETVRH